MREILVLARFELARQLGSWVTLGLAGFLLVETAIYSMNPEYVALVGAADLPRNAAYVVYNFTSDHGFWLLFFLAHLMSAPITRDLDHRFAEVGWSLPGGPRRYLAGKYLGGMAASLLVAACTSLGLAIVPALLRATIEPDSFMATPYVQIAHAYFLFLVPSVFGFGTLYFLLVARTGRSTPAYGAAFLLTAIWMGSILVLYRGEVNKTAGEWLDPIGFNSVQAQCSYWTSRERIGGRMSLAGPFLVNRAGVVAIGIASLVAIFARPSVERILRGARADRAPLGPKRSRNAIAVDRIVHGRITDLRVSGGLGVRLAQELLGTAMTKLVMAMGVMLMIATVFFAVEDGVKGPQRPFTGLVAMAAMSTWYMPSTLFLCWAVGRLSTNDRSSRLSGVLDATPSPPWVRTAAIAIAMAALAVVLSLAPAIAVAGVQLATDRATLAPGELLFASFAMLLPSLLQVGAAALFVYAIVATRWLAHFLAFSTVFACVMNHQLDLVSRSTLQYGVPIHAHFSPLTGLGPWIAPALWINAVLLSVAGALVVLAGGLAARGEVVPFRRRVAGLGGSTLFALIPLLVLGGVAGARANRAIDVDNRYRPPATLRADAAAYERAHAGERTPAVTTGSLDVVLAPSELRAYFVYVVSVASGANEIAFDTPPQVTIEHVDLDGALPRASAHDADGRHHVLAFDAGEGTLSMRGTAAWPSFANEGRVPLVTRSAAFLRDADLLPRFGYDRRRELRASGQRREQALGPRVPLPLHAAETAYGREDHPFPLDLHVSTRDDGWLVVSGAETTHGEAHTRVLDHFAIALAPFARAASVANEGTRVEVLHSPPRASVVPSFETAAGRALEVLGARYRHFGAPRLRVVEIPRDVPGNGLFGDVLFVSEDRVWDDRADNPGIDFELARLIAAHWWVDGLSPRRALGYAALGDALPVASALAVVGATRGKEMRAHVADRLVDRALRSIGEGRDPVVALARADEADYVASYGGLVLGRMRDELGTELFDARLQAALAQGNGTLASVGWPEPPLAEVDAWTLRAEKVRVTSRSSDRVAVSVDIESSAFVHDGRGWVVSPLSVDLPIAVLDGGGAELLRTTRTLDAHTLDLVVPPSATTIVIDPDRWLLDRGTQDRARSRTVHIR